MPNYGVIHQATDRRKLLKKIWELTPGEREVDFLNPKAREAYRRKLAAMRAMLEGAELGINISRENRKIGDIDNFSLPPGQNFRDATCPGATELCEKICYANRGMGAQFQEWRYFVNWAYVETWPDRFVETLARAPFAPVMRIHVGGDYYSVPYIRVWMDIIDAHRARTRFYSYTRSWQNGRGRIAKKFIKPLRRLSKMTNMRLVLSVDAETGVPPRALVPASIRAWLARNNLDMPGEPVELIFRDPYGMAHEAMSKFPVDASSQRTGSPVCPVERSPHYSKADGKITCQNCSWCWGGAHQAYGRREDDLSVYDVWARVNLDDRVAGMFRPFVPGGPSAPSMSGPDADTICVCSAETPCPTCGVCVYCRCGC